MLAIKIFDITLIGVNARTNLTTGLWLVSAGIAFALQQVITSISAYFVILRGDMFSVGYLRHRGVRNNCFAIHA